MSAPSKNVRLALALAALAIAVYVAYIVLRLVGRGG